MRFDKDKIKAEFTMEQAEDLLAELGAEPIVKNDVIVCKTICHHGDSHKLYYYANTHLLRCYTNCGDAFDIFQLVQKVKECDLPQAVYYIATRYGFAAEDEESGFAEGNIEDWKIINAHTTAKKIQDNKVVELKVFDENTIKNFPRPRILGWEEEGISREVMDLHNICYDPVSQGIVIPHYDEDGQLIGIRERTLIKENEVYGKYRPAYIRGKLYNHPLSFNLYNLNFSKNNIRKMQTAIVFEGEKSTLLYGSMFGIENDISVACCGSNLIKYQVDLLTKYGAKEIVVAFDKQYENLKTEEAHKWIKKLTEIHNKYGNIIKISFMFDKGDLLGYKSSPIDEGKDKFIKLFKERIIL